MPDKHGHTAQLLPVSNYSPAIARAVEWLGDRYLLAKPINSTSLLRWRLTADSQRRVDGVVEN